MEHVCHVDSHLLRHAHNKALLFNFVRLDRVIILQDLACEAMCQLGPQMSNGEHDSTDQNK